MTPTNPTPPPSPDPSNALATVPSDPSALWAFSNNDLILELRSRFQRLTVVALERVTADDANQGSSFLIDCDAENYNLVLDDLAYAWDQIKIVITPPS